MQHFLTPPKEQGGELPLSDLFRWGPPSDTSFIFKVILLALVATSWLLHPFACHHKNGWESNWWPVWQFVLTCPVLLTFSCNFLNVVEIWDHHLLDVTPCLVKVSLWYKYDLCGVCFKKWVLCLFKWGPSILVGKVVIIFPGRVGVVPTQAARSQMAKHK